MLEQGRPFSPGASTELAPGGPAGTFGIRDLGGRIRVVWRFNASNEVRTFTIRYRFTGLAVAYTDVVDVNLKVWGDEWEQPLGHLTAATTRPGTVVRGLGASRLGAGRRHARAATARCCAPSSSPPGSSSSSGRCFRAARSRPRPG